MPLRKSGFISSGMLRLNYAGRNASTGIHKSVVHKAADDINGNEDCNNITVEDLEWTEWHKQSESQDFFMTTEMQGKNIYIIQSKIKTCHFLNY